MKRTRPGLRTVYYCEDAGYRQGFTGHDHTLPDHHGSMCGMRFRSLDEARDELGRRSRASVPAYAVVREVAISDDDVRAAVAAEVRRREQRCEWVYAARARGLMTMGAHDAEVGPFGDVTVRQRGEPYARDVVVVRVGHVKEMTRRQVTLAV